MNSSDNFQDSALSRLMPLMNSSFTPGQAQATVNSFQDKGQRQIDIIDRAGEQFHPTATTITRAALILDLMTGARKPIQQAFAFLQFK